MIVVNERDHYVKFEGKAYNLAKKEDAVEAFDAFLKLYGYFESFYEAFWDQHGIHIDEYFIDDSVSLVRNAVNRVIWSTAESNGFDYIPFNTLHDAWTNLVDSKMEFDTVVNYKNSRHKLNEMVMVVDGFTIADAEKVQNASHRHIH